MSVGAGIAGGLLSGAMNNAMSYADSFHDWESDNVATAFFDPGGFALGKLGQRAEKKAAKKQAAWAAMQAELQWQYQKRAALEMPKYLRQGFEDAGYNALLALGQTGGAVNAVPKVEAGEFPHQIQRRNYEANLLVEGAINQQEAQIEKIKSETTRNKIHNITDVLTSLVGTLGGFYGLRQLLRSSKLLSAGTANAAAGSTLHKVEHAFKNGKRVVPASQQLGRYKDAVAAGAPLLGTLGKFGSVASLVGLTALVNELGNIAQSKGLPSRVPSSAQKKANLIRYGKPSDDSFNPRNLNFDAIRKNKRWSH